MNNSTNYFCNDCFKTFTQWYKDGNFYNDAKLKQITPKDHPLNTGICDNTDKTNHLVKGAICGGSLKVD